VIDLAELGAPTEEIVGRRFVAEITEARVQEIFEHVNKELKKISRSGMLPAGAVLTGGGSKLAGLIDVAKTTLRLPVSLGTPIGITSVIDRVNDPSMSTAIGLLQWGHNIKGSDSSNGFSKIFSKISNVDKLSSGLKNLFRSLKP
jgi:cell division protein FtsA